MIQNTRSEFAGAAIGKATPALKGLSINVTGVRMASENRARRRRRATPLLVVTAFSAVAYGDLQPSAARRALLTGP
jgi:hypothetical protein